jgi:1,4-dihydroxy-2-naphthoate octaprenyltransferase
MCYINSNLVLIYLILIYFGVLPKCVQTQIPVDMSSIVGLACIFCVYFFATGQKKLK